MQLEFGVIGAADYAIAKLCELWSPDLLATQGLEGFRRLWSQLPGAVWKEQGSFHRTVALRTRVLNQSTRIRRTWTFSYKNKRDYLPEPVRGAQGCALACSYCVESVNRTRMSSRSIEQVVDEIEFSLRRYGIRVFHMADSEANIPFQRLTDLARELIRRNLHHEILWTAYLNVLPFEADAIPLLVESGLYRFKFAFDHFADDILKSYHKNFREKDLDALLDAFEPYIGQVQLYAGILLGGPGEDETTLQYAMDRMKQHAKRGFTFYYNVGVRIYPGTPFGLQFLEDRTQAGYYGPGKHDDGLSALVYSAPQSPRVLAARVEEFFQNSPRVFRMNKEKTTGIGYEGYRRFLVAWHAWLDGRSIDALQILEETENLHLLREGLVLQRLLRMRTRKIRNQNAQKEATPSESVSG
nr:radical SAM protein [Tumebacillus amylolyticus]